MGSLCTKCALVANPLVYTQTQEQAPNRPRSKQSPESNNHPNQKIFRTKRAQSKLRSCSKHLPATPPMIPRRHRSSRYNCSFYTSCNSSHLPLPKLGTQTLPSRAFTPCHRGNHIRLLAPLKAKLNGHSFARVPVLWRAAWLIIRLPPYSPPHPWLRANQRKQTALLAIRAEPKTHKHAASPFYLVRSSLLHTCSVQQVKDNFLSNRQVQSGKKPPNKKNKNSASAMHAKKT